MEALRRKLREKLKLSTTTTSHGRRQKRKGELNLDALEDDEESREDEIHAHKVKDEFQRLKDSLSKCQVCGPEKFCKINRFGKHIHLTTPQVLGWAHALVIHTFYFFHMCVSYYVSLTLFSGFGNFRSVFNKPTPQ